MPQEDVAEGLLCRKVGDQWDLRGLSSRYCQPKG